MTAERQPLSKLIRFAVSFLVIGHLMAVLLPPLSFQTRGPLGQSPSIATAFAPLEGYSQFLYIDRGYAFFAPDPGPSHLVQAEIIGRNGERREVMFPDREEQWPRLRYHRYFMLTEYMETIYEPPGPPPELAEVDPIAAEGWRQSRDRYMHVRQSAIEHLRHENPGSEVSVRRIEHFIPDLLQFQQEPIELTDPRMYRVQLDQPIDIGENSGTLSAPSGPAETIPPPEAEAEADVEAEADPNETPQESRSPTQPSAPTEPAPETADANAAPSEDANTTGDESDATESPASEKEDDAEADAVGAETSGEDSP